MMIEAALAQRANERTELLTQASTLVANDPRIGAAWLFGSGSRGDADAFSDLDLWTVVADEAISALIATREQYVAQLGQPLLTLHVPGNAPVGGGYLMLQYPGTEGPIQVDWYWQPQSRAVLPDDAKLLFDHIGLPRAQGAKTIDVCYLALGLEPPPPATPPSLAAALDHELTCCWCMSLIAAKYVARRAPTATRQLTRYAAKLLDQAQRRIDPATTSSLAPPEQPFPSGVAALTFLRQLHAAAAALLPMLKAAGGNSVDGLVPAIERFFALAEAAGERDQLEQWVRRT